MQDADRSGEFEPELTRRAMPGHKRTAEPSGTQQTGADAGAHGDNVDVHQRSRKARDEEVA